jgi:hypothetical protein
MKPVGLSINFFFGGWSAGKLEYCRHQSLRFSRSIPGYEAIKMPHPHSGEGGDKLTAHSHFFQAFARLELAPGHWKTLSNRLPWLRRASPSATLNEIRQINGCGYID